MPVVRFDSRRDITVRGSSRWPRSGGNRGKEEEKEKRKEEKERANKTTNDTRDIMYWAPEGNKTDVRFGA